MGVLVAISLIGGTVWAITNSNNNQATDQTNIPQHEDQTPPLATNDADQPTYEEQQLALEATETMTTWTPTEDDTETAAELRARDLMTHERAAQVVEPERPTRGTDWNEAHATNATSTPKVELADGTEAGYTTVHARWQWVEGDGVNSWWPTERRAYHFTFTEENGELKISDYTYDTLRR